MRNLHLFILVITGILVLGACSSEPDSPEQQIYAMMAQMEDAIQERSIEKVKPLVSPDYGDDLHPSRAAALRSLIFYFQGHKNIHLFTRVSDLQISDDLKTANLSVYVGMAGKPIENADYLVALKADLYRFDISLINDDDWLVAGTRWERVRPESFDF